MTEHNKGAEDTILTQTKVKNTVKVMGLTIHYSDYVLLYIHLFLSRYLDIHIVLPA